MSPRARASPRGSASPSGSGSALVTRVLTALESLCCRHADRVLLLSPHPGRVKAEVASDGRDPAPNAARPAHVGQLSDPVHHPVRQRLEKEGHAEVDVQIDPQELEITVSRASGPGVFDMKCGLMQAVWALRLLRELDLPRPAVRLFLNGDEEIGKLIATHLEGG